MLHWFHSLLPRLPHYGFVLVFIIVFLNNVGLPLPGEALLLGAGFVLGRAAGSLWDPMLAGAAASFLGGICAFGLGRRLGHDNLERIHWLHLTPERLAWPERFLTRHGAKTVFIARFIAVLPPVVVNLLAGMTKLSWRTFLWFNLTGSMLYTIVYILIGYFFGKQWNYLRALLGPTVWYAIFTAIVLIVLGVLYRRPLSDYAARAFPRAANRGHK
jgi:membrane protein DedA with SNARE-associated domain